MFPGPYALPANGPENEVNLTFAFTQRNALVIGLDQVLIRNRINLPWLQAQLDTTAAEHIFVFGHMPAFKVDHDDCLDDYPGERDTFWNSLAAAGARVYFCGHDHFYDHARLADSDSDSADDLHQYVVGTAGAPLYAGGAYDGANGIWTPMLVHHEKEYGYVLVELDGPTAMLTWKHRTAPGVYEDGGDRWPYSVPTAGCCGGDERRGDIDGRCLPECITVNDLAQFIAYMFAGGRPPACAAEADIDASGGLDVADLTALLGFVYRGGAPRQPCRQARPGCRARRRPRQSRARITGRGFLPQGVNSIPPGDQKPQVGGGPPRKR